MYSDYEVEIRDKKIHDQRFLIDTLKAVNGKLVFENEQLKKIEKIARRLLAEIHEDVFIKSPRGQVIVGKNIRLTRATKLLSLVDELKHLIKGEDYE